MLNLIWAVMILLAVLYGVFAGNMSQVTDPALDSAGEAISLCLTMEGVVALWMGLMEIARKAGLIEKLTRGISPFLRFMFPNFSKRHLAGDYIATNIIANIMGLSWACTPARLKAMKKLAELEKERGNPEYLKDVTSSEKTCLTDNTKSGSMTPHNKERTASKEMCDFLILNISSLQLIPVNMIAYG